MRRHLLIALYIVYLSVCAFAQADNTARCPNISMDAPSAEWTRPGDSIIFTANVQMWKLDGLKYHWTVSEGTIISGLETASVDVQNAPTYAGKLLVTDRRFTRWMWQDSIQGTIYRKSY